MHNILHTIDVDTVGAIIIFIISAVHLKGSEEEDKKYSNPKACQIITALKIVKSQHIYHFGKLKICQIMNEQ